MAVIPTALNPPLGLLAERQRMIKEGRRQASAAVNLALTLLYWA